MTTASDYVLGRQPVRNYARKMGRVIVSVYRGPEGLRYAGPATQDASLSKPSILYRIRVKLKKPSPLPPGLYQATMTTDINGRIVPDMRTVKAASPTKAGNIRCMDCRCDGFGCPGMPPGYEQSLMENNWW